MTLHSEIFEQPACLERLLTTQRKNVEAVAEVIGAHQPAYVFLAARGSSDNAGRYANYLFSAMNGLPLALATPSLFTYYQQPPNLSNALVIGISQSGQSPDIVSVVREGKRQGCLTLAITNATESPLADTADFVVNIQAGPERAVAATKTYSAELLALAMLSAALNEDEGRWRELEKVAGWVAEILEQDQQIHESAQRYRYMQQCVVLGRGYNYATAFEWALKLKELTYVAAEPYSSADFQHGPVAVVVQGFPVLAVLPAGKVFKIQMQLLEHLKKDLLAELVVVSNEPSALAMAQTPFPIPGKIPEYLTPLVSIVSAQLFAYYLTIAKGYDPDHPRSIHKITETH